MNNKNKISILFFISLLAFVPFVFSYARNSRGQNIGRSSNMFRKGPGRRQGLGRMANIGGCKFVNSGMADDQIDQVRSNRDRQREDRRSVRDEQRQQNRDEMEKTSGGNVPQALKDQWKERDEQREQNRNESEQRRKINRSGK